MASFLLEGGYCPRCPNKVAVTGPDLVTLRIHDPKQEVDTWNLIAQCKFCNESVILGRLMPIIDTGQPEIQEDEQDIVDTEAEHSYTDS